MKLTTLYTYKSDICAAVHETATGMFEVGVISAEDLADFDKLCLLPVTVLEERTK